MRRERDIAPGPRAFYRRFEDEVLAHFLARGATPDVAADLTAETFAAALPGQSGKRLSDRARHVLDASREGGRVVADARQRSAMPPVVLTDAALARIADLDRGGSSIAREVEFDGDDDVRVRVIDQGDFEGAAAGLRLSDAVVRGRGTDPEPARDTPRIPELEDALAAAVPRRRTRRRAVLALAAVAAAVLGFLVLAHGDGRDQQPAPANATQAFTRSSEREIVRVGNAWANAFAASGPHACVLDMTPTACERPVAPAVKQSFRGASVREVVVRGRRAAVRFSNNEVVEFIDGGPHAPWQIHVVGRGGGLRLERELPPEERVARDGNEWARLFAAPGRPPCNRYMTQPACERATCQRMSGPIEHCVVVTIDFRRSFLDTFVRDVVVKGRRAAARFSNGEVVDFSHVKEGGGAWWVAKLGPRAGRLYHEQKIVRSGNAWARFFAATTRHCVEHMTPRACEQVVSAGFKRSFRHASVETVLSIRGKRAAARFSNGELVEFRYVSDGGGRWSVDRLGQ